MGNCHKPDQPYDRQHTRQLHRGREERRGKDDYEHVQWILGQPAPPVRNDREHDGQVGREHRPDAPVEDRGENPPESPDIRLLYDDGWDGQQRGDDQRRLQPSCHALGTRSGLRFRRWFTLRPASSRHTLSASPYTPAETRSPINLTKIPNGGEAVKDAVGGLARDRRGLPRRCVSPARQIISAAVERHDVVPVGERLAVPAVPALFEAQPGDPRHEVEFGRPGVSLDDRVQPHARVRDGHVALVEHLLRRIVAKHIEPYRIDLDGLRIDMLVVAQPVEEGGRAGLDHERAFAGEVGGDVLEAAHLVFLGQQVEERVEDDVDKAVCSRYRHIGEVTDGDRDPVATRLVTQLRDHLRRDVYSVHADPPTGERQRDPAGSYGEFQRGTTARQLLQERDGRFLVAAWRVVVRPGDVLTETHFWLVVLHGILSLS